MNLPSEQLGKIPFPLLQESHPVPVTYPRHKQDPLSFINDLEPNGLQSENRRSLIIPEPSQKKTEQDTNKSLQLVSKLSFQLKQSLPSTYRTIHLCYLCQDLLL